MLKGIGYKNEKILSFGLDILIVSGIICIVYLILGYPDFFPYLKEVEEARVLVQPEAYVQRMAEIDGRFQLVLMECGLFYWLYESVCLVAAGQTLGGKLFGRRLVLNWECRYPMAVKMFLMPTRTLVKLLCIIWTVPMVVIGGCFLLGKKDQTLLDLVFFTRTEKKDT